MSTQGAAETGTASAAPAQLLTDAHPPAPAPSSSFISSESTEPPAIFIGAPEASRHGVPPATHLEPATITSEAPGPTAMPVKSRKGAGKRLTDRQRVEILDLLDKSDGSLSNAEIGRRYGITRAAIQKLKGKAAEVRARYRYGSAATRDNRRRGALVTSMPFERELFEWVRGLKARKVPVPPSLVKEKAKLLVPKYGLGDFMASNGWYYNFCKRFSLTTGTAMEENAPAPTGTQAPATAAVANGDTIDSSLGTGLDTGLDTEQSPQLRQMAINSLTQQTFEQLQQYQQQMAAIAAATLQAQAQQAQEQTQHQEQDTAQTNQSKSDRMLALLEQQNMLLERQNSMIEDQAKAIKKMLAVVTNETAL